MFTIRLNDVRFFAYHGVMPQERKIGNEFALDLEVTYPPSGRESEDQLENTISYADLYEIARENMSIPRALIETIVVSICRDIKKRYSNITSCSCRVTKLAPPIPGMTGSASVEFTL